METEKHETKNGTSGGNAISSPASGELLSAQIHTGDTPIPSPQLLAQQYRDMDEKFAGLTQTILTAMREITQHSDDKFERLLDSVRSDDLKSKINNNE
jgi:hypothetical protein